MTVMGPMSIGRRPTRGLMLFVVGALVCVLAFPVVYMALERGSVEAQAGEALMAVVVGPASTDPGLPPVIRVLRCPEWGIRRPTDTIRR